MNSKKERRQPGRSRSAVSRRGFIRDVGLGTGVASTGLLEKVAEAQQSGAKLLGPGPVPVALRVNGKPVTLNLEPRVTLLDALRNQLNLTGAKKVCDRGNCGACTVMVGGKAVYACSTLAIDAQGKDIQTVESLSENGQPNPLINAFVQNDAQQCGFCTPGFVMAAHAFLGENPNPTLEQVEHGLSGNLCRCGTYMGLRQAVLQAAKDAKGGRHA